MSDGASLEFGSSLNEMLKEFVRLPELFQKRLMKGAVATGASVIRVDAVARAPSWTGPVAQGHPPAGTLKKAIYQTRLVAECTTTLEVWKVDVRRGRQARAVKRGKATANLDAYYASWVEFGHYTRAPKGSAKAVSTGASFVAGSYYVMPHPYMRPAFEAKKNEAVQAMQNYLNENIPAAVAGMKYLTSKGA